MTKITLEQAVEVILAHLPKHEGELILSHNEHKSNYQTVKQEIEEDLVQVNDRWISEEEKQKAIETNELWCLQWYPHTPVGFHVVYASQLLPLIDYVYKNFKD